jgi:hypothetical protein
VTPPADGSADSTLTVSIDISVLPGSFSLDVDGTFGSLTHSTPVEVNVVASTSGTSTVVNELTAFGCIDSSGISGALLAKLAQAQAFIDAGNIQAAINTLNALLKQLQAQAGKHIATTCTNPETNETINPVQLLIDQVEALLASLGAATQRANPILGYVLNSKGVPIAGATVNLLGSSNSVTAAATTDVTGFYYFPNTGILIAGSKYTARVTPIPKPYKSSSPASQAFSWSGAAITLSNFLLK